MTEKKITFLLLGKTGNGKSALGNTILGFNALKSSESSESVTDGICLQSNIRDSFNITVEDTPGFMDTNVDGYEAKSKACEDMRNAMATCPNDGTLALIIVLKYGERYGLDNKLSLDILINIFGEQNISKSCIIVMTHGDLYERRYKKENKCFQDWMREQTGQLGDVVKLCQYKCVLFCNETEDKAIEVSQFETLMKLIQSLDQGYTQSQFQNAKKHQDRLLLEAELPKLKQYYDKEIESIDYDIRHLTDVREKKTSLKELEISVFALLKEVDSKDSADTIFYSDGESRLLEGTRNSLEKLKVIILEKAENQKTNELFSKLNDIYLAISETNAYNENIYVCISEFREELKNLKTNANEEDLSAELKHTFKKTIKKCYNTLNILIEKIKTLREMEITREKEEISSKLRTINLENKSISQMLSRVKEQISEIDFKLQTHPWKYGEEFKTSNFKWVIENKEDVMSKEETVRQMARVDELKKEIKLITETIEDVDSNDIEVKSMLSDIEEEIERLDLTEMYGSFREEMSALVNKTSKKLSKLEEHVEIFLNFERDIQILTDKFNVLEIPCHLHNFSELHAECDNLLKEVNGRVSISSDRMVLTRRLQVVKKAITDGKKENDKAIAAWAMTFVPVAGLIPAIGLTISLEDSIIVKHDKLKELADAKSRKVKKKRRPKRVSIWQTIS